MEKVDELSFMFSYFYLSKDNRQASFTEKIQKECKNEFLNSRNKREASYYREMSFVEQSFMSFLMPKKSIKIKARFKAERESATGYIIPKRKCQQSNEIAKYF